MKHLRITLNSFEVFDKEAFCQYLQHMAAKGWMLKKTRVYLLEFEQCKPQELVFEIDYETFKKESPMMDTEDVKIAEYIDLCEASGWTFVTFMEKGFIFYHPKGIDVEPLCSDASLHVKAYFKKTFMMYTILFLVLCYALFHMQSIYEVRIEWVKSYDACIWLCWLLCFFPSMMIRCIRYYAYVARAYISMRWRNCVPKQRSSYRTFYRYYYRISQYVFLCTVIPLFLFILIKTKSYEQGISTLLTFLFMLHMLGVVTMDIVLYYFPMYYKYRYIIYIIPEEIVIIALALGMFIQENQISYGYQPITDCTYTSGVLLPDSSQDVYCGSESKVYHSFFIHDGSTLTLYKKDESMYTEFASSIVFDIKEEAFSKEIMYDIMIGHHQIDNGELDTSKLPRLQMRYPPALSKEEILTLVQRLDTSMWQVDEAYLLPMKHQDMYAFRRGRKVFVYFISKQIFEDERLKWMQQALS